MRKSFLLFVLVAMLTVGVRAIDIRATYPTRNQDVPFLQQRGDMRVALGISPVLMPYLSGSWAVDDQWAMQLTGYAFHPALRLAGGRYWASSETRSLALMGGVEHSGWDFIDHSPGEPAPDAKRNDHWRGNATTLFVQGDVVWHPCPRTEWGMRLEAGAVYIAPNKVWKPEVCHTLFVRWGGERFQWGLGATADYFNLYNWMYENYGGYGWPITTQLTFSYKFQVAKR